MRLKIKHKIVARWRHLLRIHSYSVFPTETGKRRKYLEYYVCTKVVQNYGVGCILYKYLTYWKGPVAVGCSYPGLVWVTKLRWYLSHGNPALR